MENKRGDLTQGKLVAIIITILVLAVVLWFIFGADIKNWIYNLPSYNVPKDDVPMDLTNQVDASTGKKICEGGTIIGHGVEPIILGDKATNFYVDFKESPTMKLFVRRKLLGVDKFSSDIQIGESQQWEKIIISQSILDGKGDYSKIKYLVTKKDLENLNGAYYIDGVKGNFICKGEIIARDIDKGFGTKENPYFGLEDNQEQIKDKINKKENFYFRTSGTKPENFYFHYSPDKSVSISNPPGVWMYDDLKNLGSESLPFGNTNIGIHYPVNEIAMPSSEEAIKVIEMILLYRDTI